MVTYLFGAGASRHSLPIVDDIPARFESFGRQIRSATNLRQSDYRNNLIADIELVTSKLLRHDGNKKIKLHASIDTFAKKLFILERDGITSPDLTLKKLKILMCLFFAFEQLNTEVDLRYDAFFAWEDELDTEGPKAKRILDKVLPAIVDTKILVLNGYSIPFFNREIDSQLIKPLKLDKVYIQDTNPELVKDRFLSITNFESERIQLIHNVDQFHLPSELSL